MPAAASLPPSAASIGARATFPVRARERRQRFESRRLPARPSTATTPPRHRQRVCGDPSAARDAATLPVRLRTAAALRAHRLPRARETPTDFRRERFWCRRYRVFDIPLL